MTENLDQEYWRKWGDEIDRALQDMDEFGRNWCRICNCYKFTNDLAICLTCSLAESTEKSPVILG